MRMTPTLYQITLSVTYDYASAFAECLEPHLDSVAWTAQEGTSMTEIIGFSNQLPNKDAIHLALSSTAEAFDTVVPRFKMSKIRNRNWVLDNIKKFPPLTIGQFFVHGNEAEKPIPYGKIALCIPAAEAFGTGDHGSTKGCLVALDKLNSRIRSGSINLALDMGCGSGILAIAMAKRWRIPVIATDIDPISTKVCRVNAKANGVAKSVRSLCSSGYQHRKIISKKFDVIASNILAQPLTRLARDLAHHLAPGGWAILSGLLTSDTNRILSTHALQGLKLFERITIGDWQTLVLKKSN